MNGQLRVMKFGGVSIQDAESVTRVCDVIARFRPQTPLVLVFSAMGKSTAKLLRAGQLAALGEREPALQGVRDLFDHHFQIVQALLPDAAGLKKELEQFQTEVLRLVDGFDRTRDFSSKSQDNLLAYGERLATAILSEFLESKGHETVLMDAREIFKTDNRFTRAEPMWAVSRELIRQRLLPVLRAGRIPVIQGFIGSTPQGETTTFGFEGSDYTASLLGAALEAGAIDVWKDVDGIMSTDPLLVKNSVVVPKLSYEEAATLTFLGAKVLHAKTLAPARQAAIPIRVRPLDGVEAAGTEIGAESGGQGRVKSITCRKRVWVLVLQGRDTVPPHQLAHETAALFYHLQATPIYWSMIENRLTAVLEAQAAVRDRLEDLSQWGELEVTDGWGTLSLVGEGIGHSGTVVSELFGLMDPARLRFISLGASPMQITVGLKSDEVEEAVRTLHAHFF